MDIYTRVPVNKLARIVTNQSGVSDCFTNNAKESSLHLDSVLSEISRIQKTLGLTKSSKKSDVKKLCRNGVLDWNDPFVQRLFELFKREQQIKDTVKSNIRSHILSFEHLTSGDSFEVWQNGIFLRIVTVTRIRCQHLKASDGFSYNRKTGKAKHGIFARLIEGA